MTNPRTAACIPLRSEFTFWIFARTSCVCRTQSAVSASRCALLYDNMLDATKTRSPKPNPTNSRRLMASGAPELRQLCAQYTNPSATNNIHKYRVMDVNSASYGQTGLELSGACSLPWDSEKILVP